MRRRSPGRVRRRLTLWYAISLTLICLVFSGCVFLLTRANSLLLLRAQMDRDIAQVEQVVRENGAPTIAGLRESAILVRIALQGQSTEASRAWQASTLDVPPDSKSAYWIERASNGRHYYLHTATVQQAGVTYKVTVAEDIEQTYAIGRKLLLMLGVGFPFALLISLAGGYVLAGRAIVPVGTMARMAREITADNLSQRLPVCDPNDEFGHLAAAFNDTLQRLEDAFARMRRFTSDASHELRTPLTVIRSVGENALQYPLDAAKQSDAIGSILEETERLVQLLDGLMTLARAEAGALSLQRTECDLSEVATSVAGHLQVLAEEKRQTLVCRNIARVDAMVDPTTIRQALFNLIANAIRYTQCDGHIEVWTDMVVDDAVIEVRDNGPGIAAEHHQRIFDRFYRIDADRSRETGGAGLGLAIVRWAVELNGGVIELESVVGRGSIFRVRFPARPHR
ncbi:sensor histidine kinase [Paraburkholderia ginsengisoli]|uniref:histidine kinase n=1 Tax=Paraburkholderia ginsengisoli TaxID=311231 RepID=A0A7T4N304_9BURK|nr:ATP-binding protein [Paraburkholderia ginsengisoli]QQC64315.1 HAMP domain-containing protein [Paraburkholderia ginsengisoli]